MTQQATADASGARSGPGPVVLPARAELLEQASTPMSGRPWILQQLRHSPLTHAAEDRANTATLRAYSGHTPVTSRPLHPPPPKP